MATITRSAATIARCIDAVRAPVLTDRDPSPDNVVQEPRQPLLGVLSNDDWDALLAHVSALVQHMEALPPGEHRDQVFALLDGIDAIHREALLRLVRLFKEGVLEKVVSDPAIHTLMELYDLLPEDAAAAATEADARPPAFPTIPIKSVRMTPAKPARYPRWIPVPKTSGELASGAARDVELDGLRVLLVRRDEHYFALESRCATDGTSLAHATLSGYTLTCPNHVGCYYDVRQGSRMGGSEWIMCYPVKVDEDGRPLIGFDMDFKPNLPSF